MNRLFVTYTARDKEGNQHHSNAILDAKPPRDLRDLIAIRAAIKITDAALGFDLVVSSIVINFFSQV